MKTEFKNSVGGKIGIEVICVEAPNEKYYLLNLFRDDMEHYFKTIRIDDENLIADFLSQNQVN